MIRKIRWLLFLIKYKLGLAREGVDFITAGYEECPEWSDPDAV